MYRSHWIRAVTFDEDRAQVRCGAVPRGLATIRCAILGLLRVHGVTNVAACRRYAAQPWVALALLGFPRE